MSKKNYNEKKNYTCAIFCLSYWHGWETRVGKELSRYGLDTLVSYVKLNVETEK